MSRWRIFVVLFLVVVPFVILACIGSYYLWIEGLSFILWWPLFASMGVGYLLGWYWQHRRMLLRPVVEVHPVHWTDRDKQAWEIVEARAKAAQTIEPEKLVNIDFYLDTAKAMALELAQFYHPSAKDPLGPATVPEILAVIELATHDMAELVDEYLPGGHLLTVNDWKRAKQVVDWSQTANNLYWIISAVFAPTQTALRYTASRLGISGPLQQLQQNLQLWFYTAFVHRLGTYLIDLNSGRLRVGAARYRQLLLAEEQRRQAELSPNGTVVAPPQAAPVEDGVKHVTVTLLGQVKVGKSSLINAFLGEQRAVVDVLPATDGIERYELRPGNVPSRLVLLDTPGYGHSGPREDQVRATQKAAQQSDILILVLHARNPARQGDLEMMRQLRTWYQAHPELKRPAVLGVLTHIDLLSPAMEWEPPYDWQKPVRLKEQQIQQAIAVAQEQLGEFLAGVIPVCTSAGKVYGVQEWLLPAVAEVLDEAHAVALLRCLRNEADAGKVRKVFNQLVAVGRQLVKVIWEGKPKP